MGKLRVHNIEAQTGTNVDLGAAGDVVTLASDSIQTNLYKDSGGNTLFQSDGAGTLSNVNSALKGDGPQLILSQTASASATISFTSNIDSTYDRYMFVFVNIAPVTNNVDFTFQVNAVGASGYNETITSTAFDSYHKEDDTSSGLTYWAAGDQAQGTAFQKIGGNVGADADQSLSGILNLYAPSSTTYVTQFDVEIQFCQHDNYSQNDFFGGYFNTTLAIDEIQFKFSSGNINAGTIKMYGIA